MKEIEDPIPREHAACIVRAAEINKLIINTGKCMRAEHLVDIEEAFSTVMGYLEDADTHPPLRPSDGGVCVASTSTTRKDTMKRTRQLCGGTPTPQKWRKGCQGERL